MIEPALLQDAPAIRCIARSAGVFSSSELLSVSDMLDAFFNPTPDDDYVFIVYRDGACRVEGFACYGPTPFTDRVWDLYWICVERSHQRNGVGRELIRHINKDLCAHSARAIYLETSDSDTYLAARTFYEREGFERVGYLPDFYKQGEGQVLFRKTF